MSLGS